MENIEAFYKDLSAIGTERVYQSHKTIIEVGARVGALFLIRSGGLILNHVHPKTGRERAINFFIPEFHPIATVSHAFVFKEPSKYRLKTFTNTTFLEVNALDLQAFLSGSPWAVPFRDYGVKTMLEKNELRAELISLSSEEMFQYLHDRYPQILQQVPSKYVADFLGISAQWLSKLKHRLL